MVDSDRSILKDQMVVFMPENGFDVSKKHLPIIANSSPGIQTSCRKESPVWEKEENGFSSCNSPKFYYKVSTNNG